MTKDKDFKRLVRARMARTGESYTTARAHLLRRASGGVADGGDAHRGLGASDESATHADLTSPAGQSDAAPDAAPTDLAALAGQSDESVQRATGRNWSEWVALLDAVDAHTWPHPDIARWIRANVDDVSGWWSQSVTVGYERIKGLRAVGQRRDGSYEINRSRTIRADLAAVYRACADPAQWPSWMPGADGEVTSTIEDRSVRIAWHDGTRVQLYLTDKGDRVSLAAQHGGLDDPDAADAAKADWGRRLDTLKELLEG